MSKVLPIFGGNISKINKMNNKYKCIKQFPKNGDKIIMKEGDIVIVSDGYVIYNITTGIDYKNIPYALVKDYLNNISDFPKCDDLTESEEFDETDLTDNTQNMSTFEGIINRMLQIYKEKNSDYGNSFDKTLNEWGLQASAIRMEDKLNRFSNIVKNGNMKVKDEAIIDTLLDLANYAILTAMYLNK